MSNEIEEALDDLRGCRLDLPSAPKGEEPAFWLGLLDGAGVEASYPGYERVKVSANTPLDEHLSFPTATATTQVLYMALFKSQAGREIEYVFQLRSTWVASGDTLSVRPCDILLTLDDKQFSLIDLLRDQEVLGLIRQFQSFRGRRRP